MIVNCEWRSVKLAIFPMACWRVVLGKNILSVKKRSFSSIPRYLNVLETADLNFNGSYQHAKKVFEKTEARFKSNPEFAQAYHKFMHAY